MVRLIAVVSCFCGARRHGHIEGERSVGPIEFPAGPSNGRSFFSLDLLPDASAVGAFEAEIMKVSRGGQFKRRMTFLFEFDAANCTGGEALRHELEFIAILDIAGHGSRIEFGLNAEEVGVGLREMFGREIRREHAADVFERELEKTWSDCAAKKGANFVG